MTSESLELHVLTYITFNILYIMRKCEATFRKNINLRKIYILLTLLYDI